MADPGRLHGLVSWQGWGIYPGGITIPNTQHHKGGYRNECLRTGNGFGRDQHRP
jgi:hypothetical protein